MCSLPACKFKLKVCFRTCVLSNLRFIELPFFELAFFRISESPNFDYKIYLLGTSFQHFLSLFDVREFVYAK